MKQSEANRLAENLVIKFGLPFKALLRDRSQGQYVQLEPVDVHPNEAFQVDILIGWRSLYIELVIGKFAADFVNQMGSAIKENQEVFVSIASEIIKDRGILSLEINKVLYNPLDPEPWPKEWKTLSFSLKRSPLDINSEDHGLTEFIVNLWVERFMGCVIALSPLEDTYEQPQVGIPEGAVVRIEVNRYERSRFNRALCLIFHGINCSVCNLNFEKLYGTMGAGFIHVHHIVPVSRLGPDYIINPIKDLVPVCPNCHAMLHKTEPPMHTDVLKTILKQTYSN